MANIDIFPLKKCGVANSNGGGTGPAGPQGKRGARGGSSNYLEVALVGPESTTVTPFSITVPFDTELVNKGWDFTPGQTKFIVPETGTYVLNFFTSSSIQFKNSTPPNTVNIEITQTTTITGFAPTPVVNDETFDLTTATFIRTPVSNPEIMTPLTAGDEIEFTFNLSRTLTGDAETITLATAFLSIQRIE